MTIPTTGPISASMINAELGRAAGSYLSMNDPLLYQLSLRNSRYNPLLTRQPRSFSDFRGRTGERRYIVTATGANAETGYKQGAFGTVNLTGIFAGRTLVKATTLIDYYYLEISGAILSQPFLWVDEDINVSLFPDYTNANGELNGFSYIGGVNKFQWFIAGNDSTSGQFKLRGTETIGRYSPGLAYNPILFF